MRAGPCAISLEVSEFDERSPLCTLESDERFAHAFASSARRRDLKMALFQVVIPVLGVLLVMVMLKASNLGDQPALVIDASSLNPSVGGKYQDTTLMPVLGGSAGVADSLVGDFDLKAGRARLKVFDVGSISDTATCELVSKPFDAGSKSGQYRLPAKRTPVRARGSPEPLSGISIACADAVLPAQATFPNPNNTYCGGHLTEDQYIAGTLQDQLLRLRSKLAVR